MNSVGPIGAELWVFDLCGLLYVGQTLVTHILDRIQPKILIIWEYNFFIADNSLPNFIKIEGGQVRFYSEIDWFGMERPYTEMNVGGYSHRFIVKNLSEIPLWFF